MQGRFNKGCGSRDLQLGTQQPFREQAVAAGGPSYISVTSQLQPRGITYVTTLRRVRSWVICCVANTEKYARG